MPSDDDFTLLEEEPMSTTVFEALGLGFTGFVVVRFLLIQLVDKVVLLRDERLGRNA